MPMLLPAPGLFSMNTCWRHIVESFSASMRATISVGPPAATGTMMRTGLVGYPAVGVCAPPSRMKRFGANAGTVDRAITFRRVSMIITPAGLVYILSNNFDHRDRRRLRTLRVAIPQLRCKHANQFSSSNVNCHATLPWGPCNGGTVPRSERAVCGIRRDRGGQQRGSIQQTCLAHALGNPFGVRWILEWQTIHMIF